MSEKIIGYLLLIAGISLMIFSTWRVFMLMTDTKTSSLLPGLSAVVQEEEQAPPAGLSNLRNLPIQGAGAETSVLNPLDIIKAVPNLDELVTKIVTFFLMGFLLNLGYKISTLGIQLIRPIHIKLRIKEGVIESGGDMVDVSRDKKLYPDTTSNKF